MYGKINTSNLTSSFIPFDIIELHKFFLTFLLHIMLNFRFTWHTKKNKHNLTISWLLYDRFKE